MNHIPDGADSPADGTSVPGHSSVGRPAVATASVNDAGLTRELGELAALMHRHARALEPFVEGASGADLADPRIRLLGDALEVARNADRRLGRLERLSSIASQVASPASAESGHSARLGTLISIAQELNGSLDLDGVLGRTLTLVIEVTRAERGAILLWDDAQACLMYTAARDQAGQALAEAQMSLSRSVVEQVWDAQEPLLTVDAQQDDRLRESASVLNYGIRSVMCAPLRVRSQRVGVVYVDSRRDSRLFDQESLALLAAFCNQAAIAIENAQLVSELRERISELNAVKSYMESVFASIASGVVTANVHGDVTTVNQAAGRMLNRPESELVGGPIAFALADVADDEVRSAMRRAVVERAETLGHELTREIPGRGEVALLMNISPLRPSNDGAGDATEAPQGVALTLEDLTELRRSQRQAKEIQRLFGRYVHPAVVRQLLADPAAVQLGGETRTVSVVFADIRNFTELAASLPPDAVVRTLNRHLDVLTEAIWQYEGTLTMYIGDAIMAIFNAPLPQPDHAERAVRAAWAMRVALQQANAKALPGEARAQYGIGVHTGPALVGNIGAHDRMQNYTAIGDAVNIAQRLQSLATDNHILLSADTCAACGAAAISRALEPMTIKGRSAPLSIFQMEGLTTGV